MKMLPQIMVVYGSSDDGLTQCCPTLMNISFQRVLGCCLVPATLCATQLTHFSWIH